MAKTTITGDNSGNVTLAYDDAVFDERVTREFFTRGSYVYETTKSGDRQVCDRLQTRGSTLMHHDRPLIDIIRREYRRLMEEA